MIGIIGGSGLYQGMEGLQGKEETISTPYGEVNILKGENFLFISRHGYPPKPPHRINYHANMMAFKLLKVKDIVAISSVGSLKKEYPPGTVLLPDDLIDFTGKVWTYHNEKAYHVNMYEPFCRELREKINKKTGIPIRGTYVSMKGPQFETKAEKSMLKVLGADVVGMTVAPEAKLTKELGLCYQPVAIVVNFVGGETSHKGTLEMMKRMGKNIACIVRTIITL
ncbi:MAG: MTAP family purine nucleoside phosphorylase [Thermoplasmata archaeon]|nr:MTAP family purine nucleoside phosphorylase [Thermoplasmata archaeon]